MNYQHGFHAGNFADVLKHFILVQLLLKLREKESAFVVLDTHAGSGRYDLADEKAERTSEWRDGIGQLTHAADIPTAINSYLQAVNTHAPYYPGSPLITASLLREHDRLVACELHPEAMRTLKNLFRGNMSVRLHQQDAYLSLKALLPFEQKRGLVLIDPPFEKRDEWQAIIRGIATARQKCPNFIFAVWYPIKNPHIIEDFYTQMELQGFKNMLASELYIHPADDHNRLNGCGMLLINTPWQFDSMLDECLPWLKTQLAQSPGAFTRHIWLTRE